DESCGDLVEDRCGEVVVAEELLIAFEGSCAERDARFGVEGVLDVVAKDGGFDRLLRVPVEEVGEEDKAGHGIEFFGGSAEGVAEVFRQFADGHDLEDGMSKGALPAVSEDLPPGRWYDPFKGV